MYWIVTLFNSIVNTQKLALFCGLCNNSRPLGRACGKCVTSKGGTEKVRCRLALVKLVTKIMLNVRLVDSGQPPLLNR